MSRFIYHSFIPNMYLRLCGFKELGGKLVGRFFAHSIQMWNVVWVSQPVCFFCWGSRNPGHITSITHSIPEGLVGLINSERCNGKCSVLVTQMNNTACILFYALGYDMEVMVCYHCWRPLTAVFFFTISFVLAVIVHYFMNFLLNHFIILDKKLTLFLPSPPQQKIPASTRAEHWWRFLTEYC